MVAVKKNSVRRLYIFICIWLIVISSLVFSNISHARITNPIPEKIEKSKLIIGFEDIAQIPGSGTGRNKVARLNFLTNAGDGSGRLFVNDMRGKLYVINNGKVYLYMNFKNLVCSGFSYQTNQQGFGYFAFHPDFANNGLFYTVHTEEKNNRIADFTIKKRIFDNENKTIESSHHDVILEWKANNPAANYFTGRFREIMRVEEPYEDHNVGQLGFNPNAKPGERDYGMLYIALADGGSDGFPVSETDPLDNGQNLNTPLGKILRINPNGKNSGNGKYGIPEDNPFVNDGDSTLGEIWAYGLRNPHRFSWDTGGNGKMLAADTGQAFIEEVNLIVKGSNYGWGNREGTWVIKEDNDSELFDLPKNDARYNYTYPVAQYDHDIPVSYEGFYAIAITGGYVYRGKAIPELVGEYIFADFGSDARFFHVPVDELVNGKQAQIKELRLFDGQKSVSFLDIIGSKRSDVRFGIGEDEEIYVTSKSDGKVRKLVSVKNKGVTSNE